MKVESDCKHAVVESSGSYIWTECKLHDCTLSPGQCSRCRDRKRQTPKNDQRAKTKL